MASFKHTVVAMAVAVVISMGISSRAMAQPPGDRAPGQGGFGAAGGFFGGIGGGGLTDLLQLPSVREELELVDDQMEKIRALQRRTQEEARSQFGDLFQGFRELSQEEQQKRREQIREKLVEARKKTEAELQEILLPHQYDRLKQIQVQASMRRGTATALQGDELASSLNITDAQKEKLRETGREAQEDLEKQMEELRTKMREKILAVLTPEQRKKLDEMSGKPFEMRDGFGGFGGFTAGGVGGGRFGGGRGGQGGDRGNNN